MIPSREEKEKEKKKVNELNYTVLGHLKMKLPLLPKGSGINNIVFLFEKQDLGPALWPKLKIFKSPVLFLAYARKCAYQTFLKCSIATWRLIVHKKTIHSYSPCDWLSTKLCFLLYCGNAAALAGTVLPSLLASAGDMWQVFTNGKWVGRGFLRSDVPSLLSLKAGNISEDLEQGWDSR